MELKPITTAEFKEEMLRPKSVIDKEALFTYFEPYIKQAENFAVAPYFWLIPNQEDMTLIFASDNIRTLTPFTKEEWVLKDSLDWMNTMHPEDRGFLGAAITLGSKTQEDLSLEKRDKLRLNIYCRMLNANNLYRWVLLQFPKNYYDENGKICSTLILATDLTHLTFELKCTMTIIDPSKNEFKFFSTNVDIQKVIPLDLAVISKREHEILVLMTKGLNSPEIAEKLFISYHTVENHKRNLRQKTKTRTSAELIHYIWINNLI